MLAHKDELIHRYRDQPDEGGEQRASIDAALEGQVDHLAKLNELRECWKVGVQHPAHRRKAGKQTAAGSQQLKKGRDGDPVVTQAAQHRARGHQGSGGSRQLLRAAGNAP